MQGKRTVWHVRPTKTKSARAVRSESSLSIRKKLCIFGCPKMRPMKILIRLRECAGWSESSLGAHVRRYLSWCFDSAGRYDCYSRCFFDLRGDRSPINLAFAFKMTQQIVWLCKWSNRGQTSVLKKLSRAIWDCAFGAYAGIEGPDQTAHARCLNWAFAVRL